ncbi:NAD-dependent epimerase/dehydratase family protein [Actinoplanes sp. NEAU-A12]|uniref:UDP-glucose 4-epimerase n=1 Tax=Actinoplanes sandaracinus TaxID=3045177 RepID=A0ABT6WYR5_9ACTN|nr:NAD-dependent epimerase/dehydratase family protein [Actinoplanes sandaracinus]MDI6104876.1 NAD-dependent epimerase/dehydratase family protein [Actinoplanes sandaracinus]
MTHVLVTGGAGFIGTHVVTALLGAGHQVTVVDCGHPGAHRAPLPDTVAGAPLRRIDLRDRPGVAGVLAGVDVVIHQAAMVGLGVDLDDLPEYVGCNDLGTAVLLAEMARADVGRLVLASSMVVYGEGAYTCPRHGVARPAPRTTADLAAGRFEPACTVCGAPLEPGLVDEEAPLDPRSVYAATKVAQEHLTAAWSRQTGGTTVALRYHNVYGPGMPRDTPYSGVAAIFRSALEAGRAPRVFEDGGQRRDFVHVRDVAAANLAALHATGDRAGWRAYNIASGRPATIAQMAGELARAAGGPSPVVTGEFRLGDVRHVVASPARAEAELGFRAAVGLADGVAEFASAPLRG